MNAVLTGMESECAATVVVHWQWQVGTVTVSRWRGNIGQEQLGS